MNSDTSFGLILAGVGAGAFFGASYLPPDAQKGARIAGGVLGGLGLIIAARGALKLGGELAASGGLVAAVGDVVIGKPGPSDTRKVRPFRAAKPGKITNLQRITGTLTNPGDGVTVARSHFFGSAYPLRFEINNWGDKEREVEVKLAVHEQNAFGVESPVFSLGRYMLPPDGGSVLVEAEASVESWSAIGLKLTGRLYGNNFLLDRNDFFVS